MSYAVVLTKTIKDAVRKLSKRYRHVADDLEAAIDALLVDPKLGTVIPGGHGTRKLRVASRDAQRGKSGGYRVIYYTIDETTQQLHMLYIYWKGEKEDISIREIEHLLKQAGLW